MPGATRLGDKAQVQQDAHGCPGCPHPGVGPAISGSPDVMINGRPAVRLDDVGIHAVCCGSNMWSAAQGSSTVFVNGKPVVRRDDQTRHCGGQGKIIEGSDNVIVGGSPSSGSSSGAGGGTGNSGGSSGGSSESSGAGGGAASATGSNNNARSESSASSSTNQSQQDGRAAGSPANEQAATSRATATSRETTTFNLRLAGDAKTSTERHSFILKAQDGSWSQEKTPVREGSTDTLTFTDVPKNKPMELTVQLEAGRTLTMLSDFEVE